MTTCDATEPGQFWQFTTSNGLMSYYVSSTGLPTYFFLNVNNSCTAGQNLILTQTNSIYGYESFVLPPNVTELVTYNSVTELLTLCGQYIDAPTAQIHTSADGRSYLWSLLLANDPPGLPMVIDAVTYDFETPTGTGNNAYPGAWGGAFIYTNGGVARNGSSFDPYYAPGTYPGPPSGYQYSYILTGQSGVSDYWMNATYNSQDTIGIAFLTWSFWVAMRSTNVDNSASLSFYLNGAIQRTMSLTSDLNTGGVWTQVYITSADQAEFPIGDWPTSGMVELQFLVQDSVSEAVAVLIDSLLVTVVFG